MSNDIQTTTIDLLRHGECEGGHIYRGEIDVSLSEQGWQQMEQRCQLISPDWDGVVSSPMQRCIQFSRHMAQTYQLPLTVEQGLRELSFGDWEGQEVEYIWNTQREAVEAWGYDPVNHPPPNGEAADVFSERVIAALHRVLEQHRGQHILLVSHGGVMRALLAYILSMPVTAMNRFDLSFACLSRVVVTHTAAQNFYRLAHHNIPTQQI